jgi:uncharacterized membrane protein
MENQLRFRWGVLLLLVVMVGCTVQPVEDSNEFESPFSFDLLADVVATGIEMMGIGTIIVGIVIASLRFGWELFHECIFPESYQRYRERLGQAILLGLEFLVAADIIGTVAVDPTFRNIGVLGAIVTIRTFLSFALEVEIHGRWPWELDKKQSRCACSLGLSSTYPEEQ